MLLRSVLWALSLLLLSTCQTTVPESQPQWLVQENTLLTPWAAEVDPKTVHDAYPRPQLVRERWLTLNGLWEYAITAREGTPPEQYDGTILVPFPIESALSGVQQGIQPDQKLWYRREVLLPERWSRESVLLNFGAVDWQATVWVNGQKIGEHRGGYTPFSLDITAALRNRQQPQEVVVEVWDPTDTGSQPTGKQSLDPQGIWYTPTTGIWQTVWLEPVPQSHVERLKLVPDVDQSALYLEALTNDASQATRVRAIALAGGEEVGMVEGPTNAPMTLSIDSPKLWSPASPYLYDLRVDLLNDAGQVVDRVTSYFGLRKVAVARGPRGHQRLFLNNELHFMLGPLDQGFWPGGLYTAPSDQALRYDVEMTKEMGFNMARKHVKVEPARWYYWCDKLGLLVWQDMPSGDERVKPDGVELIRNERSAKQFEAELEELMDHFYNHPSIVMWVIFNEGWGQYDTERLTAWAEGYDSTRLINPASGWLDVGAGRIKDIHRYPGPALPEPEANRVAVLGEFGGQALAVDNHLWVTNLEKAPTHFKTSKTPAALQTEYATLIDELKPLIEQGLAAAVYTQTTDVESEVNGLMTYDRAVLKIPADTLRALHQPLYNTP